jgi:valyl-tRNA synthetase
VREEELDLTLADRWILSALQGLVRKVDSDMESYNFSEACRSLYEFFWNDFCDWYVELSKLRLYGQDERAKRTARYVTWYVLERVLRLLHPFMPFITEEIWQRLPHRGESLVIAPWPRVDERWLDREAEEGMDVLREVIVCLRRLRAELGVKPQQKVPAVLVPLERKRERLLREHEEYVVSQARLSSLELAEGVEDPSSYARGVAAGVEVFVPLKGQDFTEEIRRLRRELARLEEEARRSQAKLANDQFLSRAPVEVVQKERKKLAETRVKMERLREQITLLGG